MARRIDHEHIDQCKVVSWALEPCNREKYPGIHMLFAVPNAGKREPRLGKYYKDEGLKAGVPDLVLPVARRGYHGLVIEMKVPKTQLSNKTYVKPHQRVWLQDFKTEGYLSIVCWGYKAAIETLKLYLEVNVEFRSREQIKKMLIALMNIEVIDVPCGTK